MMLHPLLVSAGTHMPLLTCTDTYSHTLNKQENQKRWFDPRKDDEIRQNMAFPGPISQERMSAKHAMFGTQKCCFCLLPRDLWVQAPAVLSRCSQNTVVFREGDKTKNSSLKAGPGNFLERGETLQMCNRHKEAWNRQDAFKRSCKSGPRRVHLTLLLRTFICQISSVWLRCEHSHMCENEQWAGRRAKGGEVVWATMTS